MRPCNHLCWADAVAFAAWAGLRPMTELEYEKACRGPGYAHHGELAWGQNAQSVVNALAIIGSEAGDHYATGNCNVDQAPTSPGPAATAASAPSRTAPSPSWAISARAASSAPCP